MIRNSQNGNRGVNFVILTKLYSPCKRRNRRIKPLSGDKGFTLIELMVTVAIIGIVAAIAVGSLNTLLPRYRTKSAARQVRGDLQKAKLEAVKQNETVLVDFNVASGTNPGSCITCFDKDSDDDCDSADDIITQTNMGDYAGIELQSASFTSGISRFSFNSRGLPINGGTFSAGTAVINCTSDAAYSLSISLASSGRLIIQ